MIRGHRKQALFRWIDALAPKSEFPVSKRTVVLVDIGILHDDGPSA